MVEDRIEAGADRRGVPRRPDDAAVPSVPAGTGRHRATPAGRRRPSARPVLVGPIVGLAIVLAVVAGWPDRMPIAASAPPPAAVSGSPASGAAVPPPGAVARWLRVLDGVDAIRSRAYERGDLALLGLAWAPGERLRADTSQLQALLATGCTARGVRHRFDDLAVVSVGGRRVRLRVTQWLPASERMRGGRVVGRFAGTAPTTVTLDLLATDGGWRLG